MTTIAERGGLRCSATDKAGFLDAVDAMAWVEKRAERPGWGNTGCVPIRTYLCPHCGWYHITSQEAKR